MLSVRLRPTTEDDIAFVTAAERHEENRLFVRQWPDEQHLAALHDGNIGHYVLETCEDNCPVGYAILVGKGGPNRSIELRRLVVTEKGGGVGRQALREIKRLAFEEWKAHRLWLDVKTNNPRAKHLYDSEGFVVDGIHRECIWSEGRFESLILMSMLEDDYKG
jgi:diamine N-acetyltransferase